MILPPTSEISHHHIVTNITISPTSLSPISSIILKTFCEFEGFDLAKEDIKEKALRDTKRNRIFIHQYCLQFSAICPQILVLKPSVRPRLI